MLSTAKTPRWIEKLSRIYRRDRELKNLAWWIEEAVDILSRRNLETSMDWKSVKICREKEKEGLDRSEICRGSVELKEKEFFKKGKTYKDPINMLSSENISQHICKTFIKHVRARAHTHTHTHTHNKSNQFYISKTSLDSLVSIY